MISTKSQREIELMRIAGEIVAKAHDTLITTLKPGITTRDIDTIVERVIRENGATPSFKGYNGFPAAACTSINSTLVHGIPDSTVLKDGDIISVDIGACFKGYHGDSAWTYAIGNVSPEALHLMEVTKQSLFEGLKKVKPGNRISDVSNAIGEYVYGFGYTVPFEYTGHGIGAQLHEDPSIPNYGEPGRGALLKKGMCLAIEPMVHMGKPFTRVLSDDWTVVTRDGSLAAHYEHTVVVTDDGYEILTVLRNKEDHSQNG
ncbi:MAG: type I methionyl aminopeptidase [Erysipelotrichaceae bacterium]